MDGLDVSTNQSADTLSSFYSFFFFFFEIGYELKIDQ